MDKNMFPVRNPDVVERKEEAEALLFDPATGNILCVNTTGIFIWEICDGSRGFEDIVGELTGEYDVAPEKAEEDCHTYLDDLEKAGFIGKKV